MKEKFTLESLVNMFYSKGRQAEIAQLHESTWSNAQRYPSWPSTQRHMRVISNQLKEDLIHLSANTDHKPTTQWANQTIKYMKTLEMFDE